MEEESNRVRDAKSEAEVRRTELLALKMEEGVQAVSRSEKVRKQILPLSLY